MFTQCTVQYTASMFTQCTVQYTASMFTQCTVQYTASMCLLNVPFSTIANCPEVSVSCLASQNSTLYYYKAWFTIDAEITQQRQEILD